MAKGSTIIESVTRKCNNIKCDYRKCNYRKCDYRKCNLRKGDNIMWSVIVDEITLKSSITKTEPFQILNNSKWYYNQNILWNQIFSNHFYLYIFRLIKGVWLQVKCYIIQT